MRIYKPLPLGDTGITEFVTRWLTGGKITSPRQPYVPYITEIKERD